MNNKDYLQQLLPKLAAPFPYQWRVQNFNREKTKAMCVAYIDARDVMNVLDKHCEYGWTSEFYSINNFIFCKLGIGLPDGSFLYRSDAGARPEENENDQMYDQAAKSAASDALKRAAVNFGVGRFLYDLEIITLPGDGRNVVDDRGQKIWDLTKHINQMKGKAPAKPTPIPAPEQKEESGVPKLDDEKLNAMLKALDDGKVKEVEAAMKKYNINLAQRSVLTAYISKVKAAQVTAAAKAK